MTNNFSKASKSSKTIRLVGKLSVKINGQVMTLSENFRIQTDISYSGMSIREQETAMRIIEAALANKIDAEFLPELEAEEVKSSNAANKEPSALDKLLDEIAKPDPVDLLEASVREDTAVSKSIGNSLSILGADELPTPNTGE